MAMRVGVDGRRFAMPGIAQAMLIFIVNTNVFLIW